MASPKAAFPEGPDIPLTRKTLHVKSSILAASILLLATACAGEAPPVTQAASTPDGTTAAVAGAKPSDCPAPFYSPLPDAAIRFDFPFHLHLDRIYRPEGGELRQRVVLEYLQGDAAGAWRGVEKAMKAAGYRRVGPEPTDFRATFTKSGMRSLFIDTSGGRPEVPANPKARGTVWISWSLDGTPAGTPSAT